MADFSDRLDRAIQRGQRIRRKSDAETSRAEMSADEAKSKHSAGRLELSEYVEGCLKALVDRFPGFQYANVYSEDGWGGRVSRDDLRLGRGDGPREEYSRLELVVPPLGEMSILSLTGKAAVRNKELFNRSHFQRLEELDLDSFKETIDLWVLEYAERYSATA